MAKIVVIDDDNTITDIIKDFLTKTEHEVITFNSSIEGLKYLKNEPVDILFTDIFMPEKDGYEVVEEIKKMNKNIKVISSSAGMGPMNKEHTLNISKVLGSDATLEKPFDINELLDTINKLL